MTKQGQCKIETSKTQTEYILVAPEFVQGELSKLRKISENKESVEIFESDS